jgi:hypothetical protein
VRAEEKELEGPELEREQSLESMREAESEQEELPEIAGEQQRDAGFESRSRLLDALQLILAGEEVNVTLLYLPQRETHALETLQAAVKGSDEKGEFVFAEDRRSLLEQALAVLQQNMTYGDPAQMAALQNKFDGLVGQVGELRAQLVELEDAQEDIEEWHSAHERGIEPETDDKPDEKPETADTEPEKKGGIIGWVSKTFGGSKDAKSDDADAGSTLSNGPDAVIEKKPSTLSTGPDVVAEPRSTSLTGGPDIGPARKPSSLYEDDADARAAGRPTDTHDPAPQRRVIKLPEPVPTKKP